jgi:hypothetical protein
MKLQREGTRCLLQLFQLRIGSGTGRVEENGDKRARGDRLVQNFQPLRRDLHVQARHAREITARPGQAGNEADRDRVGTHLEDDRDARGGRFRRERGGRTSRRDNHGHLASDEVRRQVG